MFMYPKMSDLDCTDLYPPKVCHSRSNPSYAAWLKLIKCRWREMTRVKSLKVACSKASHTVQFNY